MIPPTDTRSPDGLFESGASGVAAPRVLADMGAEVHVFLGMPVVVRSEPMRRLLELAGRVGRVGAAVLITGESGAGKELLARALHHYSSRCSREWVDLNCGALPELLMESELFGYEKGAFSGATGTKPGLFELAHGGSLYLDEIGELAPRLQVKLLRVLDGAPYYRLGGIKKVSADSRVIASTNQDLEQAMAAGSFRHDLYHRLAQVTLRVPPLRERRADIAPLAQFFLAQYARQRSFSADAIGVLEQHSWPGNVRELRNVIVQASVMTDSDVIRPEDLPVRGAAGSPAKPATLDEMERQMILQVMKETGGQHQRTATILGISLRTLGRKLKQYQESAR